MSMVFNMSLYDFVFDGNTPYDYSNEVLERKKFLHLRELKNESKRRLHIERMNRWINDLLFGGVCRQCGKRLCCNPGQNNDDKPEFHHMNRADKTNSIDHLVNNYASDETIYREIQVGQVVLLCHKCHAKTDTYGISLK